MSQKQQKNSYTHSFLLLLTATVWGLAFVAQSVGMDDVGPYTFLGVRSILAVLALLPVVGFISRRVANEAVPRHFSRHDRRPLFVGGSICGVLLFFGMILQQIGIQYTTIGKAGFITTSYVVMVPLLGVFLRRHVGLKLWIAVVLSVLGLYLLCMTPGELSINKGDFIILLSAVVYTLHITVIDHYAPEVNGVLFSFLQMVVVAVIGVAAMFVFEDPQMAAISRAFLPIAYAGVFSSGVGFTLQMIGQKGVSPTVASLIMSLESCISLLAGWAILGEVMSQRELFGCVLMFVAIILSQLPSRVKK